MTITNDEKSALKTTRQRVGTKKNLKFFLLKGKTVQLYQQCNATIRVVRNTAA